MSTSEISITETASGRLAIQAPYDKGFISGVKKLGGRWEAGSKCWTIAPTERKEAEVLLGDVYGWMASGLGGSQVIVLTAKRDLREFEDGIRVSGRTIARATGRDSGARLGDGVVMLDGYIYSGGSRKNWTTSIRSGSKFRLELPLLALDTINRNDWDVEYAS